MTVQQQMSAISAYLASTYAASATRPNGQAPKEVGARALGELHWQQGCAGPAMCQASGRLALMRVEVHPKNHPSPPTHSTNLCRFAMMCYHRQVTVLHFYSFYGGPWDAARMADFMAQVPCCIAYQPLAPA